MLWIFIFCNSKIVNSKFDILVYIKNLRFWDMVFCWDWCLMYTCLYGFKLRNSCYSLYSWNACQILGLEHLETVFFWHNCWILWFFISALIVKIQSITNEYNLLQFFFYNSNTRTLTCFSHLQGVYIDYNNVLYTNGAWGSVVVKALRYFSDGPQTDSW